MHTRIGNHPVVMLLTVADKPRIVVMSRRTRADTVITPRATIQIDHHRLRPVDQPMLNQKLEQPLIHTGFARRNPAVGAVACG
jgi:hypothetical protein